MYRPLPAVLALAGAMSLQAGEVRHAEVDHRQGEYRVELSVLVRGTPDELYAIATDFDRLPELNDVVLKSAHERHRGPDGQDRVRRQLETRTCLLLFCYNATLVEELSLEPGHFIQAEIVEGEGDFRRGSSTWRFTAADEGYTLIEFHSRFEPDFSVLPILGPLVIKRTMLDATQQTIMNMEKIAAGG